MKIIQSNLTITVIPEVTVDVKSRVVTVSGPRGQLVRSFRHIQVDIYKESKDEIKIEMWWANKLQSSCIRTIATHIKNMMIGVTKGFIYKMRFVYAHFPIIVTILDEDKETAHGTSVEIRNFLGEKKIQTVKMLPGCTVVRTANVKDEICIHGNDIEHVSKTAARIHQSLRVRHKDIRKFLDGIYVSQRILGDVVHDV